MGDLSGDLLTRAETARYLGLPVVTLANWAYAGRGPRFYKVGRHTRYKMADLLAWLESNARDPRSVAAS